MIARMEMFFSVHEGIKGHLESLENPTLFERYQKQSPDKVLIKD